MRGGLERAERERLERMREDARREQRSAASGAFTRIHAVRDPSDLSATGDRAAVFVDLLISMLGS